MLMCFKSARISFRVIAVLVALTIGTSSVCCYVNEKKAFASVSIIDQPLTQTLPMIKPKIYDKPFHLPLLRGIEINPGDAQDITFYFDTMNQATIARKDIDRMINYFLGFLTIPRRNVWVNLSPYEKDRMLSDSLSQLTVGKDLLLEDYLLKQITSFMTNPATEQGKRFWKKVHAICYANAKTTKIPVDTFNKIWIVPQKAVVVHEGNRIFVKEGTLRLMVDEDYAAFNVPVKKPASTDAAVSEINRQVKELFKKEILPVIEQQVNNSITFAPLRQIFYCLILADYVKSILKNNAEYAAYIDAEKTGVIGLDNPAQMKNTIHASYVNSFKKGMYADVKKEYDPYLKQKISRRYFSGGGDFTRVAITPGAGTVLSTVGNPQALYKIKGSREAVPSDSPSADFSKPGRKAKSGQRSFLRPHQPIRGETNVPTIVTAAVLTGVALLSVAGLVNFLGMSEALTLLKTVLEIGGGAATVFGAIWFIAKNIGSWIQGDKGEKEEKGGGINIKIRGNGVKIKNIKAGGDSIVIDAKGKNVDISDLETRGPKKSGSQIPREDDSLADLFEAVSPEEIAVVQKQVAALKIKAQLSKKRKDSEYDFAQSDRQKAYKELAEIAIRMDNKNKPDVARDILNFLAERLVTEPTEGFSVVMALFEIAVQGRMRGDIQKQAIVLIQKAELNAYNAISAQAQKAAKDLAITLRVRIEHRAKLEAGRISISRFEPHYKHLEPSVMKKIDDTKITYQELQRRAQQEEKENGPFHEKNKYARVLGKFEKAGRALTLGVVKGDDFKKIAAYTGRIMAYLQREWVDEKGKKQRWVDDLGRVQPVFWNVKKAVDLFSQDPDCPFDEEQRIKIFYVMRESTEESEAARMYESFRENLFRLVRERKISQKTADLLLYQIAVPTLQAFNDFSRFSFFSKADVIAFLQSQGAALDKNYVEGCHRCYALENIQDFSLPALVEYLIHEEIEAWVAKFSEESIDKILVLNSERYAKYQNASLEEKRHQVSIIIQAMMLRGRTDDSGNILGDELQKGIRKSAGTPSPAEKIKEEMDRLLDKYNTLQGRDKHGQEGLEIVGKISMYFMFLLKNINPENSEVLVHVIQRIGQLFYGMGIADFTAKLNIEKLKQTILSSPKTDESQYYLAKVENDSRTSKGQSTYFFYLLIWLLKQATECEYGNVKTAALYEYSGACFTGEGRLLEKGDSAQKEIGRVLGKEGQIASDAYTERTQHDVHIRRFMRDQWKAQAQAYLDNPKNLATIEQLENDTQHPENILAARTFRQAVQMLQDKGAKSFAVGIGQNINQALQSGKINREFAAVLLTIAHEKDWSEEFSDKNMREARFFRDEQGTTVFGKSKDNDAGENYALGESNRFGIKTLAWLGSKEKIKEAAEYLAHENRIEPQVYKLLEQWLGTEEGVQFLTGLWNNVLAGLDAKKKAEYEREFAREMEAYRQTKDIKNLEFTAHQLARYFQSIMLPQSTLKAELRGHIDDEVGGVNLDYHDGGLEVQKNRANTFVFNQGPFTHVALRGIQIKIIGIQHGRAEKLLAKR